MAKIGNIFATQMATNWYKNMVAIAKNNMGHEDQPWLIRAQIAFDSADLVGHSFTSNEIEDKIEPFIGRGRNRNSIAGVLKQATTRGIIRKTGRKKYVEGVRNPYPEYEIVGHVEIDPDSSAVRTVRVCDFTSGAGTGLPDLPARDHGARARQRRTLYS